MKITTEKHMAPILLIVKHGRLAPISSVHKAG